MSDQVPGFERSELLTSGFVISPQASNETTSVVNSLCSVDFGAIGNHTAGTAFVEGQAQLISALRAKFSESKDDIKGLTSRTKNLFVEKENLRGDLVNDAVINTWVADLVHAAAGTGVDGWEYVRDHEGVTIDSKRFGDAAQILCVRGRAQIAATPEAIFAVVSDVSKAATYDKFFINGRTVRSVVQKGTTSMFVNWAAFQTGSAMFSDRDFCFLQVNQQINEKKFVVLCRSVEDENVPEKGGFVRGDIWTTGFIIESYDATGTSSVVTYVCALDLQGLVPKLISNILLTELPLKLSGIQRYFLRTEEADARRSGGFSTPTEGSSAAPKNDTGADTSRVNFLRGTELDAGLVTPGRPLQEMYVPKSGADKALPKLAFDNLGPQTGGPKKKK